jgi:hypothetical protein
MAYMTTPMFGFVIVNDQLHVIVVESNTFFLPLVVFSSLVANTMSHMFVVIFNNNILNNLT